MDEFQFENLKETAFKFGTILLALCIIYLVKDPNACVGCVP